MSRYTMYALVLGTAVALAVTGGADAACMSQKDNDDFFVRPRPKNSVNRLSIPFARSPTRTFR